jgi:hypothetical protein
VNLITVRPTRELRVDFARWAVAQTPKVRTCSTTDFAVPAHLFTHMPERLLIGSLVDGHQYVPPVEDERPENEAPQWLTAVPGEPLPPVPDAAYPPHALPLPDIGQADTGQPDKGAPSGGKAGDVACDVCQRPFGTRRGLDAHRRQAHPEA